MRSRHEVTSKQPFQTTDHGNKHLVLRQTPKMDWQQPALKHLLFVLAGVSVCTCVCGWDVLCLCLCMHASRLCACLCVFTFSGPVLEQGSLRSGDDEEEEEEFSWLTV